MSIVPSGVTVKEGTSVDLAASISDVTQVTPRWLQPSVGEVTQDGHYTAPLSNTPQAVVVIAQARVTGNQPGDRPSDLIAGALISVVRATPSQCDEPGPPGATLWRYILFVAWMGAIGGLAHGMGSFATYVGNNDLKATWLWWYALRPVISAAVAVLVYLVFRAGLGAPDLGLETTECLKIGGFAGLIGLFAEPAMIKLRDVFDAVFTPRRDPRGDKAGTVAPPSTPPQIEGLDKNEIEASHDTLTISGKNFSSDCVVRIGSRVLTPGNRSSTSLQVNIASGDVAPSSDSQDLVVINHPPGGDVSQPVKIIVK
jgi:hypothetical protein